MYCSSEIAYRIRIVAKDKKISLKQVLNRAGLGENTLANFKTSFPKVDNLAKIADVLDCSIDFLIGRSENPSLHSTVILSNDEELLIDRYKHLDSDGKEIVRAEALKQLQELNRGETPSSSSSAVAE